MERFTEFVHDVTIDNAQSHANLTLYPLRCPNGHPRDYLTLDEALAAEVIELTEVDQGGRVPTVAVNNTSQRPILLVIGEELVGAKQNRVLNTSLLVPVKTQLHIPVSCVEQGRWAYNRPGFHTSSHLSHHSLRSKQTENVSSRLHTAHRYDADQAAVWGEVKRASFVHGAVSSTDALHDVYQQTQDQLQAYVDALAAPDTEGILVAIHGHIVGADLFDHVETLQLLWPKLIRSYALDALEQSTDKHSRKGTDAPATFLSDAREAQEEAYESVGLGKDIRLTGSQLNGSCLWWDERFIHIGLFRNMEANKAS